MGSRNAPEKGLAYPVGTLVSKILAFLGERDEKTSDVRVGLLDLWSGLLGDVLRELLLAAFYYGEVVYLADELGPAVELNGRAQECLARQADWPFAPSGRQVDFIAEKGNENLEAWSKNR